MKRPLIASNLVRPWLCSHSVRTGMGKILQRGVSGGVVYLQVPNQSGDQRTLKAI